MLKISYYRQCDERFNENEGKRKRSLSVQSKLKYDLVYMETCRLSYSTVRLHQPSPLAFSLDPFSARSPEKYEYLSVKSRQSQGLTEPRMPRDYAAFT